MKRPLLLLIALLLAQFAVILRHHARPLITDELYYFDRARYFAQHGAFHPIAGDELAVVRGAKWGTSDWRPQGYSVFLGAIGLGSFDDPAAVRLRATIVQFALTAALLLVVFSILARSTTSARARWLSAIVFGVAPWPFEYANDIGPDAVALFIAGCGLLLMWRWVVSPSGGRGLLFAATLTFSLALLFRPEMIVLPPVVVIAALLLRRLRGRTGVRDLVVAALAFAIVVGAQVAYRTTYTGRLGVFGGLHITNAGAFNWTRTWLGTEKEAYDFVYAITEGRRHEIPARAFDDARERALVERLERDARARGYSPATDAAFQWLADQRTRRHPMRTILVRLTNVVQVWINLETPSAILEELAPLPRFVRRPLLGGLLLLRIYIVIAACVASWRAGRRWRGGESDPWDALTMLMFAYIVARTLLVGIVLDWRVHRYVLSAWIPMLWCAARALSPTPARRSPSRAPEVSAAAAPGADGGGASG